MAVAQNAPSYIVAIGGSAGSLEAFEQFIEALPTDTGMAFVIIQHLDPDYKAKLPDILQNHTRLPVHQIENNMPLEANSIYVIPPNKDIATERGVLHLYDPAEPRGLRLPVDFFLRQLAEDQGEKAVGVILSGMGSDGSLGLRTIKERAGLAMAQAPESAKFDGMPRSAIDTGVVDYVVTPSEMPALLINYSRHAEVIHMERDLQPEKTSAPVQKILALLHSRTKHDFSLYKRDMVYRRIKRRMSIHLIEKIADYMRYLQENPHEVDLLFKELLIGVTSFFRDPEAFEALKVQLDKHVVQNKEPGSSLRAWIIGCSTGEEAYSIAMLLSECQDAMEGRGNFEIQVFATDIDKEAIDSARHAVFKPNIAEDVTPERLKRFFVKDEDNYRLKREIREMVVFAPHDIISDPPFTKMDIVSCRNLLIYFSPELQKKIVPVLHYSLNPGGLLFLGASEGVGGTREMFTSLDNKHKIFQHKPVIGPAAPLYLPPLRTPAALAGAAQIRPEAEAAAPGLVQRLLLEDFAPPGVLVNEEGDILYISGRTGKYLEPSPGKANLNIYAMAREGLKYELAGCIQKVIREDTEVSLKRIRVKTNGDHQFVNVTIRPVHDARQPSGLALVVFEDVAAPRRARLRAPKIAEGTPLEGALSEMEQELARARERLEATVRQAEAAQEEQQSTNEELQSANEELQSTNEELMTSKEEMQSLNEELITVNAELQRKVEELSRSNSDMNNLLNSTDIATMFLDADLRIRRFTPRVADIFNMIDSDIGRPITDLASSLRYDALAADASRVLDTLATKEVRVTSQDGRHLVMRIMPYVTSDKVVDGVVVTINDITSSIEESLKTEESFARHIVDTVRESLLILDADLNVITANQSFYSKFRVRPETTERHRVYDLGGGQWNIPALRDLLENILPGRTEFNDFRVEAEFPKIGKKSMLLNARRVRMDDGRDLILLAMEDITGQERR